MRPLPACKILDFGPLSLKIREISRAARATQVSNKGPGLAKGWGPFVFAPRSVKPSRVRVQTRGNGKGKATPTPQPHTTHTHAWYESTRSVRQGATNTPNRTRTSALGAAAPMFGRLTPALLVNRGHSG